MEPLDQETLDALAKEGLAIFMDILKNYLTRPDTMSVEDWYEKKGYIMFQALMEVIPPCKEIPTPKQFRENDEAAEIILYLIAKLVAQCYSAVAPKTAGLALLEEVYNELEDPEMEGR